MINKPEESRMERQHIRMGVKKRIALIAHDGRKKDMLEWAQHNASTLRKHVLFATGSTGGLIQEEAGLSIHRFMSGPLGGDQQIGAKIAEGDLDILIFFWDPLQPQPHDPDVKALLRIAVLHNIPTASNRSTADFLLTSSLMNEPYDRIVPNYSKRLERELE
jgi:methylglyoxal synthase